MTRRRWPAATLALLGGLTVGCRAERPAAAAAATDAPTVPALSGPASMALAGRVVGSGVEWHAARRDAADSVGRLVGDSAVRLRRWPLTASPASAVSQLCGAVALGQVPALAGDTTPLPMDTAVPPLGVRRWPDGDAVGVRWLVPGAQAQYHFEGVTRDGRERVSFRWPVRSDPRARLPVGAPDAVIEAALTPTPDALDAVVRQVVEATPAGWAPPTPDAQRPRLADAVPLRSDLPFHRVALSRACPTATFRLPMIARVDQRVRVPVAAGDVLEAVASVEYGAVQVAFEEVGLDLPATGFLNVPTARAEAARDGTLTLRLSLQVVAKRQRPDQDVLLRLTRRRP